jgi:mannose-6-phosphate isomerase-like protein (cupin superfamily)
MTDTEKYLQIQRHTGIGYVPLVFSAGWQAAILNWEAPIDLANLTEIECHAQTDEVFVLWRGQAALFVKIEEDIYLTDMEPGVIYTVTCGTWHSLVVSKDASLVIVENRDTHLKDTQIRLIDQLERAQILKQLPEWTRMESEKSGIGPAFD